MDTQIKFELADGIDVLSKQLLAKRQIELRRRPGLFVFLRLQHCGEIDSGAHGVAAPEMKHAKIEADVSR